MEGIHLKDEAICHYYREIHKGLTVPDIIYQAIKSTEPIFLSSTSSYGAMYEYIAIAKKHPSDRLRGGVREGYEEK